MRTVLLSSLLAFPQISLAEKLDGEVRYYDPGKRIDIGIRPEVDKSYNLSSKETIYKIDPAVSVGSKVEVEETKDEAGQKLVTIHIKS